MNELFESYQLGELELKNRIVMAPMTRGRANPAGVQSELAIEYYAQRASAGLIITEGSQISAHGMGYVNTPGIHNRTQMEAWKRVVDAVHRRDGRIFLQLWHVGRVSHPDFLNGEMPVAPSALAFEGTINTPAGPRPVPTPRALSIGEIKTLVDQYGTAADLARQAGFDGVELHGANGYLLDQFLRDGSNLREDEYGGSLENRMRFPLEVVRAVLQSFEPQRVGYRISPNNAFHGMSDSNTVETFSELVRRLNELQIGYVHIFEFPEGHPYGPPAGQTVLTPVLRKLFENTYTVNGAYTKDRALNALRSNGADLIAFGQSFLANPDLPERLYTNAELNAADRETFYSGGAKGYTDYPALND